MFQLQDDQKAQVLASLVEGNSLRATTRLTGVSRTTIHKLLLRVGEGCELLLDQAMRDLPCRRVQVDEIWCFVGKKQRHLKPGDDICALGDFYTFIALDADTKLIPCYRVDKRDTKATMRFMGDLASRIQGRIQLSSDQFGAYKRAVCKTFKQDVDFGQIVKVYSVEREGERRYSPPAVSYAARSSVIGSPDMSHISTSYVERQNLTIRMSMRRFTRLTNAFSKKLEYLKAAVALHMAHYNFCRQHSTIKEAPAVAAGILPERWTMTELVRQTDPWCA